MQETGGKGQTEFGCRCVTCGCGWVCVAFLDRWQDATWPDLGGVGGRPVWVLVPVDLGRR